MYPNQNFRKHFPEYELPQDCSSVSRSCCLKIGTYLVIDKIVKSFEIPKMIKDDQGLPVFGYSIAYDSTNSIPLFYEQYPGSIVDISQSLYQ